MAGGLGVPAYHFGPSRPFGPENRLRAGIVLLPQSEVREGADCVAHGSLKISFWRLWAGKMGESESSRYGACWGEADAPGEYSALGAREGTTPKLCAPLIDS